MVIFAVLYGQMQNLTQQNLTQLIQTLIYEKESKANFITLRYGVLTINSSRDLSRRILFYWAKRNVQRNGIIEIFSFVKICCI